METSYQATYKAIQKLTRKWQHSLGLATQFFLLYNFFAESVYVDGVRMCVDTMALPTLNNHCSCSTIVLGQRRSDKVASSTFQKHHKTNSCTILPVTVFADLAWCRPGGQV